MNVPRKNNSPSFGFESVSLIEFAVSSLEIFFDSRRIAYHFAWRLALSHFLSASLALSSYWALLNESFFLFFWLHHFDRPKRSKKWRTDFVFHAIHSTQLLRYWNVLRHRNVSVCKCICIISTTKTNKTVTAMLYLFDIRNRKEFKSKLAKHVSMSRLQWQRCICHCFHLRLDAGLRRRKMANTETRIQYTHAEYRWSHYNPINDFTHHHTVC